MFETTHDVSGYTAASLFQAGARVETVVRFSTTIGHLELPDAWRDVRGFAVKFRTDDGDYDLVGNNSPVFFLNDPIKFASLVRAVAVRRGSSGQNPAGAPSFDELFDYDRLWEFFTTHTETAHQVTWLFGDRGIPLSWRHLDGFGTHTYQWVNALGERFWVKYHFISEQGTAFLDEQQVAGIEETEVGYYSADLAAAIDRGEHPAWSLFVQIMPYDEAERYRFNPFDVTKIWAKADFPLVPVGRLVLDRNPGDFEAQIEQAAFSPASIVPGVGPSPDTMLQARIASYPNFHKHRVVLDRAQRPTESAPGVDLETRAERWEDDAELLASAAAVHAEDDDFAQAGTLVRSVLDDAARTRLVTTIAQHIAPVKSPEIRERAFRYWQSVDESLGRRIRALFVEQ
ncbi:catalase [Subtercola lobariae]|uniref:Catalase n=1 Tax=Subtercola lobariae TaxID=1588641 RepID=A0A917B5J5_9MICO|nr:catalase [Subtercola lobariae]